DAEQVIREQPATRSRAVRRGRVPAIPAQHVPYVLMARPYGPFGRGGYDLLQIIVETALPLLRLLRTRVSGQGLDELRVPSASVFVVLSHCFISCVRLPRPLKDLRRAGKRDACD